MGKGNGSAEKWIVSFTNALRTQLPAGKNPKYNIRCYSRD